MLGSRIRDGWEAGRELSFRGEGTVGDCATREGTWRNVDVFRVRIEVELEPELADAAGFASDTTTGEEVEAKGVAGMLEV